MSQQDGAASETTTRALNVDDYPAVEPLPSLLQHPRRVTLPPVPEGMSKNQFKKLLKRQRALEARSAKKAKDKDERRAKAIAQGRDLAAEHKRHLERTTMGERKRRLQHQWDTEMVPKTMTSFQLCIDCNFEASMRESEIASLGKQIRYCYAYNKKSSQPCRVAVTGLTEGGPTRASLEKETGFQEWKNRSFHCTPKSLEEYYDDQLQNVVYLTSDSETTIHTLENGKIYVIGGIVDRNRLKGAALERAKQIGIGATAKLPLDDHLAAMASTKVLTCNHVFDILLKYREFGNDWGKALEAVLPSRKEAQFKKDDQNAAAVAPQDQSNKEDSNPEKHQDRPPAEND